MEPTSPGPSQGPSGAWPPRRSGVRPLLVALAESQPLPTFIYGPAGDLLAFSRSAERLCAGGEERAPRPVAYDGTDLWTIVAGRSDEATPVFDMRVRLKTVEGDAVDSTLTVAPLRGSAGSLGGAIAYVTRLADERRLPGHEGGRLTVGAPGTRVAFSEVAEQAGLLASADFVCLVETDADESQDAWVLAAWAAAQAETPSAESLGSIGAVLAAAARGRRFVSVMDGQAALAAHPWLERHGFRAYIASGLFRADGRRLGVLACLWKEPPQDVAGACAIISIVAVRAADVLARLATERELKESEQRYGAVFEGSATPILLIEPGTTQIVDANPAACAYYGYRWDDLVTMSVLQIDALSAETVQAELERAVEGARERFASKHRTADGTIRDVEVSTGSIMVGGRRLLYYMVSDVTERLRMQAEIERHQRNLELVVSQRTRDLLRANAELQRASVARDMIFASLTQETRTSLQTVTGFSELMLEGMAGELNEEQRRQTTMVLEAGRRLSSFLASLIESQRQDVVDVTCEPETFDLVDLIESVVFGLDSFAADKGLEVRMVAESRPLEVETDRYKLQKILLNLLSNAIRYTERGAITVTVATEGAEATVTVADMGVGIPADQLQTLFDGPESHEPAAGIGLPASQRIAAVIGGAIEATSVVGQGSVFTLRLPVRCGSVSDHRSRGRGATPRD